MTATDATPSRRSRPPWRQRWKRTPPQNRVTAAGTLGDLFEPRRGRSLLVAALAASLIIHALTVAFVPIGGGSGREQVAESENTYLRKVMQKQRARHAAVDVSKGITAPPPPPDPEQFVSDALTEELAQDLSQVTGGLLDIKLEKSLTDHVQASLETELKEASRQIATGKLSKDQIKQLHRRFKQKAMDAARDWREVHREEYQVEIAAKTVTEWYEQRIASQIRNMVRTYLFTGRIRLWDQYFGSAYNAPGFIGDDRRQGYVTRRDSLLALADGRFHVTHFGAADRPAGLSRCKPMRNNMLQAVGWPDKPSGDQAEILRRLVEAYRPGWKADFDRYVRAYYPHEAKKLAATKQRLDGLWKRLAAQAKRYADRAKASAPAGQLKGELDALRKAMGELNTVWASILVPAAKQGDYRLANQTLRSRVLRGAFRDVAYRQTIDLLVERLRPPVEQLAESQFREGMVLSEKGVHEAMKEFRVKAIVLLRRDMENTISRPLFYRKLFHSWYNPYRNPVTNDSGPPSAAQIEADEAAFAKASSRLPTGYVRGRSEAIQQEVNATIVAAVDGMLDQILTKEGRLKRAVYAQADTVDYADPFKQKLEARDMAWKGRRQDLMDLTAEGVPETSTPLVALASGAGQGQIALKPVVAIMRPGFFSDGPRAATALRWSRPTAPPPPAPWGFVTQAEVPRPFHTSNFEGIPFLVNFPDLDGDLGDWGKVRPLLLRHDNIRDPALKTGPTLVYAAWNYQGFFFGYHVDQKRTKFSLPSQYRIGADGVTLIKDSRISAHNQFVERGDFFVVMFDTLDARLPFRGDPHAQEFYLLPRGTATDPDLPGAERVFASRRHGQTDGNFGWSRRICHGRLFPPQPRSSPDGTGPHRVTRMDDDGYTVEVFLPRSIFKVPVFAPGWFVGFDCYVGMGKQPTGSGARYAGKGWANHTSWPASVGNNPARWGDLLMLGTDARFTVQDAAAGWARATALIPGHSYLLTVVDPDRNVHLAGTDTVLVSAEVIGGAPGPKGAPVASDVELYVLRETGKNTSTFRGYINTQPGAGADVRGVLEVLPGREVRLRYVDIADARGRRNVICEQRLPAVSATLEVSRAGR